MIRPFGLRDAWLIKHLQARGTAFDLKRRLLSSSSPILLAVAGLATQHHAGAFTYVHEGLDGSGRQGFVQLTPRDDDLAWDLTFLSPSLDDHKASVVLWQDLLSHAVLAGVEEKVLRLYARCPDDAETETLLRRAGFSLVTREEVFAVSTGPGPAAMPRGFREADSEDGWALRELHRQVVPPLVFQAQGTSEIDISGSMIPSLGTRHHDYLWTEKGRIIAHLSLESGAQGHWIECVVRPDYRADLLPYIKYLMSIIDVSSDRPIYFSVPDYSVGLGWLLRTLGYDSYAEQLVMVAHTVSRVAICRPILMAGMEGTVDIVPRG